MSVDEELIARGFWGPRQETPEQVAEELRSQYLLGFDPPKRDGKVHDIQIKVNQPGMKPRARKNYVAPKG